jgi:hypothetical protein
MHDAMALALNAGELTIILLVGKPEEDTPMAGTASVLPPEKGALRLVVLEKQPAST